MEVLKLQEECFNSIKSLCSNYAKDSQSRKTEEYLLLRVQSLENQWRDFEKRHAALETIEDKSHSYFTDGIFNKTQQLYLKTKNDIDNLLRQIRERKTVNFDLSGTLSETEDEKLKSLLSRQECNFKALDRAMSKVDLTTMTEKWELEDHLSILKSKWDVIDKLHWELEAVLKGSDNNYYSIFVSIEDKYDDLKRKINSKIWSTMHYQQAAPKIEIPEFSGNYSKWISFKDLFLETIHNNPMINKAQKMQHLKTKLRGEAERLVQHLNISAENYTSCWEILSQRYDNLRLQFTSLVNTMLNSPVISQPDSQALKKLHDVITECMNGLSNIGISTTNWDPLIVHLMLQKLDATTYTDYMKELQDHRELPHLDQFLFFLESKFMAYEGMKTAKKEMPKVTSAAQKSSSSQHSSYRRNNYMFHHTKTLHTTYVTCPHCEKNHPLMNCRKFIDMDTAQRNSLVAKLHLCKNCLYSHGDAECSSVKTCKECKKKHHTMLHYNKATPLPSTSSQKSANHLASNDLEILLTTVQLRIKSIDGTYVTLRALLDQGSQVNLITEQAAQLLRLPRKRVNATISGVGALSGDCKGRLELSCKSIHSDFEFETQVLILKKLTNNLPNSSFETPDWPHLKNLKLADPDFNKSSPIDLLLGADIYSNVILEGVLKGNQQAPIAQQTHLGWILCGKTQTFNCHTILMDFNSISKFWEHEDITQDLKDDIPMEDQCEQYYLKTVQRASDGKYTVKMPFIPNYEEKIGNSRSIAISQFLQLEKRLKRNANLARMYRDFIKEYTELGHMKLAPTLTTEPECYLPHHGVLREHSTTTKLRVVFNASQKTSSGYSLNHLQEKGPNLQKDIQALILKWRSHRYAYTADIEKMYRCIGIADEQQQLQKIIWRNSSSEKLRDYVLCTVTYGMKSAPWLAMRTLKQLAIDDGHKYPEASHTLQNEFYVDDLISGHSTIPEAQQLQSSLIKLLQGAGMNLRKWSSNDKTLLQNLSQDQISTEQIFDFKHEDTKKTLGLGWNTTNDTFTFSWDLEEKSQLTKRHLLSEISKLYDPLGWLAPITVAAKLLFQRVWTRKLAWDEVLPTELQQDWIKIRNELHVIKSIKLNRWLGWTRGNIELLCFCDASEKAYSCVIYSRVINEGFPTITLLAAKTRVAPLAQKITLPRMELCGALLLSQLATKVIEALKGHSITVKAWSDSQVVIAWLQGDMSRWEKYVANRVSKIKQVIPAENWNYVRSELNPADCASRGMYATKLINFDLWWKGPDFIQTLENNNVPICLYTTNIGLKPTVTALSNTQKTHFIDELINKHSSLTRIIRVTARVLRFCTRKRNDSKSDVNYLTTNELTTANELIIKHIQQIEFEQEYGELLKNKTVSYKSPLYKLNPYLDEMNIIRVGGRLKNSNLPSEMKNPMILSRKGRLTQLVIDQAHSRVLHGGARLTLAYIRQRYWIVGGNRAVKTRLRQCVTCHRHKPTEAYQLMSDLPKQRTQPSRPFTHSGVDFTGHVEIKLNKGRGVKTSKGYVAIFVCMATKAVHIELVSDLSTETFLAAFQRMCARRGTPKHVYSDCGTNFIGAAKKLRKEFEEFRQSLSPEFFSEISKLEVEWHFNAPAWPSAGGLWEAAVKSLKYHLRRVLGEQKLTYEEFTTLLTKIEACMNSRPLCPLTEDPEEFYNYLTPGHFLTGSPILTLPLSDYSDIKTIDIRRRWQLTENMLQQFWKSWSNEYLTQLQGRSKWNKPMKNLQKGDIVLIKEDNLPPGKWAMGRVIELHPGSDGRVRVTTLKTKSGILKRPVVKLSPLPIETESSPQQTDEQKSSSSSEQKPSAPNSQTRKRTANKTFTTLLITLFTLVTGVHSAGVSGTRSSAHITSFEPDRPVYYDALGKMQTIHDEWILLMYYNLTNYWDGMQRVENYLHNLTDLCHKTDPRYCETTLGQLHHEMELLQHYNSILLAPHQHLGNRKKRGLINGIGSIANSLFGVLDQDFADKYHQDITNMQNNQNYLMSLMKNQTSIVELENKVLKKTEENIHKQLNMVDNFMNETNANLAKFESTMEIIMASSYFNSASLATYLLLKNLREMQELLFDTLTNVYKGHMDVHLLTPVNLMDQLTVIAGNLPKRLSLPLENVKEDIRDIYKILYVKARVTSNYFLFEVHIPLTTDEDYLLYKVTPIPVRNQNGFAITPLQSQYIAVNFKKNSYISPSEKEIKQCTVMKQDRLICNENIPIYSLESKNAPCEAKLLSHRSSSSTPCDVNKIICSDSWIQLHSPNTWLAVCCGACTLRTVCDNDVRSFFMNSSGIVTLEQGCVLQSSDLTIHSHNEYNTNMKMVSDFNTALLNSTVNSIVNLTYHKFTWDFLAQAEETDAIDQQIQYQKGKEILPETISTHDVNHYAMAYTLLAIVIFIIIILIWVVRKYLILLKILQTTATNKRSSSREHDNEEIELQPCSKKDEIIQNAPGPAALPPKKPPRTRGERQTSTTGLDNIAFSFD